MFGVKNLSASFLLKIIWRQIVGNCHFFQDGEKFVVKGLHASRKSEIGEDLDLDELIKRNRCHKEYFKLEDCLADFDRDWRKCQEQVKKLKQCNDRINQLSKAMKARILK